MSRGLLVLAVLALSSFGFAQDTVQILVQVEPPGSGFVSGAGTYPVGTEVRLEAEPVSGFRFVAWEEGGRTLDTSPVLEVTAERDRELVARFEALPPPPELSGRWIADFHFLPNPGLESSRLELAVKRKLRGVPFTLAALTSFSPSGWTSLSLRGNATLAGISLSGGLSFDPLAGAYKSAYLGATGSWEGLRWNLRVTHSPFGGVPPGPYLLYTLNLYFSPLSLTLRAEDGAEGLEFRDLLARMSELPLLSCPGQASLSFTKDEGSSYLDIRLPGIDLCCGVSLDARVKFTVDAKEISLSPRWAGLKGCLSLYGNADWDKERFTFQGIELYGWKIRCCLDCNACPGGRVRGPYLEVVSALDPSHVPGGFRGEEFEYWKFGACGPACCGGYWSLEPTVYFSHSGGLLGISRLKLDGTLPILEGLKLRWTLEVDIPAGTTNLDVGWDWTF